MLKDLKKLREILTQKYLLTFWDEDRDLPFDFKTQVTNIDASSITYNKSSFVLTTASGLKIYFPNQLWAIAAYFSNYYKAIEEYSTYVKTILNLEKEEIKSCYNDENNTKVILSRFSNITNEDRTFLIKFLSDYRWWGGGKTIDRQDYYYSPIISLCGLVNASQGFVAELSKYLASNDSALSLLEKENERIAATHQKRLVASPVLSDFCVEIVRFLYENGIIDNLISYATYSDCSLLEDGGKKIKIATDNGSLTGLLLTLGSNNLEDRSDKERWHGTPIIFDEKEAYISNQWCAPAGHQLTLVDLQNVLDDVYPSQFSIKEDKGIFYLYSGKEIYEPEIIHYQGRSPLQKIYYGAPGTGKSNEIKKMTAEGGLFTKDYTIRTTFHPDSDYASFVGAYKPYWNKDKEKIVYGFRPQSFLKAYIKAWKNPDKNVALVVEEINRGNCAQIFGDIFQLLDRENNGLSKYPIVCDLEMQELLAEEFTKESKEFGAAITDGVYAGSKDNINNYYSAHYDDAFEKIKNGEILALPMNLSILATMNTSDQSLFPMDSAFKRRWDWIYEPIVEGKKEDGTSLSWKIEVDNTRSVDWWKFLQKINAVIYSLTSSEDKQLGYFFCQPDKEDGVTISRNLFVGKVIFYLWNEIFKDYAFEHDVCKKEDKSETLYFADFYEGKNIIKQTSLEIFFNHLDENQPKIDGKDVKIIEEIVREASTIDTPINDANDNEETIEEGYSAENEATATENSEA